MRVFDLHLHVQPWQMLKPEVLAMIADDAHRDAKEALETPDALLRYLDDNGVERACCINYVSPDVMGFTRDTNDWIATFTKGHRDRLLPVGSVNPHYEKDVAAEIRRVLDLGIAMVKIHPPHQLFSPNAYLSDMPTVAAIYEECERRGVPVMFHTGTSVFPRARNRFANPMAIDDVAVDFPKLKIVMAHAGRPLYGDEAFFLVRRHSNVSVDISGIPPKSLLQYIPRLRDIADRVLWGTDWPSPGVVSIRKNIDAFLALELGGEIERKVLWENAVKLFAQ
jgi:Predicted metal-dependent hydrolase of the TIM-barrel fold